MPVVHASITDLPILPEELRALVSDPTAGAVSGFVGQVRSRDPEARGEVVELQYSSHPDAERVLRELGEEVEAALSPDGEALIALSHRTGRLSVGEVAIVVWVSSPHRALAMSLCKELVEQIKTRLPIWKRQVEADGTAVWSGLAS